MNAAVGGVRSTSQSMVAFVPALFPDSSMATASNVWVPSDRVVYRLVVVVTADTDAAFGPLRE